jgi:Helix-turn-helix domain
MPHKFTEAIFRAKLPLVDKAVLWVLSERANANGVCWPGQGRIAADAGCDYTTASRALKRLEHTHRVITHTGWHGSQNGPTKEFTIDLQRIQALGVGEVPSVGGPPR